MADFFGGHQFKKGEFITPLNQLEQLNLTSWSKNKSPEYLWISLIIMELVKTKRIQYCCI